MTGGDRGRTCWSERGLPSSGAGSVSNRQHQFDRGDSGDWILAKLADPVAQRADQPPININRAAAHSGHHPGIFGLGSMESREDHVLPRTERIPEDPEDFDLHRLGNHALEDRVSDSVQPPFYLGEGKDPGLGWSRCRQSQA